MLIGYDEIAKGKYYSYLDRQKRKLQIAIDFCKQYASIEGEAEVLEFAEGFKDYVYKRQTEGTELASLKPDKVLPMLRVDFEQISLLEAEYLALERVPFVAPDFSIHAETEAEKELFNSITKLCKAINSYEFNVGRATAICQSFDNCFSFDLESKKFIPSAHYVKSKF